MKYTTEQLELIAMMLKIQFADKTVGDFFPDHCPNYPGDVVVMVEDFNKLISFEDKV